MKNKRLLLIITLCVVAVFVVVIGVLSGKKESKGMVDIQGLASCSNNINKDVVTNIDLKTYALVKSANDYNKLPTASSYKATVRSGSCQQPTKSTITDSNGKQRTIQTTSLIVDIPNAKQSWKIAFDWVTKNESVVGVDLGTIKPSCLKTNELVYGDFKCDNIVSLAKYGTDKADPILQYMPYTGAGFRMEYEPNSKTVTVFFDPPSGTTDTAAFVQNTKDIVPYWFQKRGLDQSKYTIKYSDQIDSPDDNQQ